MNNTSRIAFFPGSFNPFTAGHLDILCRTLRIFSHVVIGIGYNEHKTEAGDINTRLSSLKSLFEGYGQIVTVTAYSGLTVDAAKKAGASCMVRGYRNATDAEYERTLADINRIVAPDVDTILFGARPELAAISSSAVRELEHNGYDTSRFIATRADVAKHLGQP